MKVLGLKKQKENLNQLKKAKRLSNVITIKIKLKKVDQDNNSQMVNVEVVKTKGDIDSSKTKERVREK